MNERTNERTNETDCDALTPNSLEAVRYSNEEIYTTAAPLRRCTGSIGQT